MGTSDMPDAAPAAAPKVAPQSVALRASPRPVTRLNRRILAVGAGTLAAAVLGGTLWSLQSNTRQRNPATELFSVDRVSHAENLDKLPMDYAGTPSTLKQAPPVPGEPLPGDLGPAIFKAQQPMEMRPPSGSVDTAQAERLATEEFARSSVFFRNCRSKEAFIAKASDTSTPGSLQLPASPYQVMAGTIISAALVTGINSDPPGQVSACSTRRRSKETPKEVVVYAAENNGFLVARKRPGKTVCRTMSWRAIQKLSQSSWPPALGVGAGLLAGGAAMRALAGAFNGAAAVPRLRLGAGKPLHTFRASVKPW